MNRMLVFFAWLVCAAGPLGAQGVAYVVDNGRGEVEVIGPVAGVGARSVPNRIPSGRESSEILILPNNHFAFVSNQADNSVAVLDLYTPARVGLVAVGQAPGSLVATPDGRF